MKSADALKHTVAMLVAGFAAAGLILAATLLSPAAEPELHAEEPGVDGPADALTVEAVTGRWEFVNATNPEAFIEFTKFGSWFGSDGCNGTGAAWNIDDDSLVIVNDGISTLMFCDNMNLPTGSPLTGVITGSGELEVTGDDGTLVTLTRTGESRASLTGTTWVTSVNLANPDAPVSSDSKDEAADADELDWAGPMIEFMEDGSWSGSDGCNRFFGSWNWEHLEHGESGYGAVIHLGEEVGSTRMACTDIRRIPETFFTGDLELRFFNSETISLRDPASSGPDSTFVFTPIPRNV